MTDVKRKKGAEDDNDEEDQPSRKKPKVELDTKSDTKTKTRHQRQKRTQPKKKKTTVTETIWKGPDDVQNIDKIVKIQSKMYADSNLKPNARLPITKRPWTDLSWATRFASPKLKTTWSKTQVFAEIGRRNLIPPVTLVEWTKKDPFNLTASQWSSLIPAMEKEKKEEIEKHKSNTQLCAQLQIFKADQKRQMAELDEKIRKAEEKFDQEEMVIDAQYEDEMNEKRDQINQAEEALAAANLELESANLALGSVKRRAVIDKNTAKEPLNALEKQKEKLSREQYQPPPGNNISDEPGDFTNFCKSFNPNIDIYLYHYAIAGMVSGRGWNRSNQPQSRTVIPKKGQYYLPVVRYADIYYSKDDRFGLAKARQGFLGTFFYVDPNSPVLLHLGNTRVFATKYAAYEQMLLWKKQLRQIRKEQTPLFPDKSETEEEEEEKKEFTKEVVLWMKAEKHYQHVKKFYAKMTATTPVSTEDTKTSEPYVEDQTKKFYRTLAHGYESFDDPKFLLSKSGSHVFMPCLNDKENKRKFTIGDSDWLDQPLAKLMVELKIDTIVLQHEEGAYRAVTEILDVRTNPYQEVYRTFHSPSELLVNRPFVSKFASKEQKAIDSWYTPSFPYCATIWAPLNGFLTPVKKALSTKKRSHKLFVVPLQHWKSVSMVVDEKDGTVTPTYVDD